jgi:2-polyprenyl-3-methyl-5-hydroxy-6-metoxy-1,4-benzoquinol methylase
MTSADEIRDVQRAAWAGLSAGWEKWDSVIMDQLGPVGAAMIERLGIAEDQQHLDIAAGTGEPGLSIARLSPKGRVALTDLVAEMLGIAARRARAQGIANIETKEVAPGSFRNSRSADTARPAGAPVVSVICRASRSWGTSELSGSE